MGEGPGRTANSISLLLQRHVRSAGKTPYFALYVPRPDDMLLESRNDITSQCDCKYAAVRLLSTCTTLIALSEPAFGTRIKTYEKPSRDSVKHPKDKHDITQVVLGILPQSHIYSLVVICHATVYRGDQVINLPKFELGPFLGCIQRFKINELFLVS